MGTPYINAKIMRIVPSAVYKGRIYDQDVFLELPDGKVLDVFDEMKCKPEFVGSTKKITISVTIADINKIYEKKFGVNIPADKKTAYQGYTFYGEITSIDERRCEIVVNIGNGNILASPTRAQLPELHIGDYVSIFSVRTDLHRILDV